MVRRWLRRAAAVIALLAIGFAVQQLESERIGLDIATITVGTTPATVYRPTGGAPAPAVVIAHGFAGSRQLMEAYALTLARAGYVVVAFDLEGHGRNPRPMSGDVTRVDGTTRLLMAEIGRVTDAALALPGVDGRVALLGHSMASDILVRRALEDSRVAATVAVSMFSRAVTADAPRNLLMIAGEWEGHLREDALRNLRIAAPTAGEGDTVGDPTRGTARRAVAAPSVEHVGVLYSQTALREARDWLDRVFERTSAGPVSATGGPIVLLLVGIVLLAWPLASLLPRGDAVPARPSVTVFLAAALLPALVTPLALRFVETRFLPVLVADYLAVHLLVYGALSLAILATGGVRLGRIALVSALAFAAYGLLVFGGALDRYVASFFPVPARLPIIAAIATGAIPFMLADALATEGGRAPLWRVLFARFVFLASLGAAVALDFQRLFFLVIIIPVILLFFTIFGLMGGFVGRRTGSPAASGLALGLILAWALGVTFPLFVRG
jgi:pimeloyl-ACP methyl ester carboxylesterase